MKGGLSLHPAPSSPEGDALEALSLQETCKKPGYSEASTLEIPLNYTETGTLEELQLFQLPESSPAQALHMGEEALR